MQPRFGEPDFTFHQTNETNKVLTFQNAEQEAFFQYRDSFLKEGFEEKEAYSEPYLRFAALKKKEEGIFLCYFPLLREFSVVKEEKCNYFSFENPRLPMITAPQITQLHLTDFGLSYVVRLSDGRFIVFDGGWNTPEDRKTLFDCLIEQSEGREPCIACWILTHPHGDHHRCFNGFWEEYEGKVKLESVLWHFPAADDTEHYPKLAKQWRGTTESEEILLDQKVIQKLGVKQYVAHTGQNYSFGDARLRIFGCMENTIHVSGNINTTSLVIRMELGGQVILWTGDAYCAYLRLAERYGNALKADILQIFHHGFSSGKAGPVKEAYDAIAAPVCFLPTTDLLGFATYSFQQPSTRYLFDKEETKEVISGEQTRTIALPYHPAPESRTELWKKIEENLALCGKTCWEVSSPLKAYALKNVTYAEGEVTLRQKNASGEEKEQVLIIAKRDEITLEVEDDTVSFSLECSIPLMLEER